MKPSETPTSGNLRIKKFFPEIIQEAKKVSIGHILKNTNSEEKAYKQIELYLLKCVMSILGREDSNVLKGVMEAHAEDPELGKYLQELLVSRTDVSLIWFCLAANAFYKRKGRIYKLGEEFFKEFVTTPIDKVTFNDLPTDLCGYVELPFPIREGVSTELKVTQWYGTNMHMKGFFFYCGPLKVVENGLLKIKRSDTTYERSDQCVLIGYKNSDGVAYNYSIRIVPKDKTMLVKDSYQNILYDSMGTDGKARRIPQKQGFHAHIVTVFNILTYLNSGTPDLREFRNNFRFIGGSKEKVVKKDKELTRNDVVLVGFNYKKPKEYHVDQWYRRGGWVHQRHGPGHSQIKIIWRSEAYPRPRSKKHVEVEG